MALGQRLPPGQLRPDNRCTCRLSAALRKATLPTFDGGLLDFHTRVIPLFMLFGYPAVIALVGR